MSIFNEFINYSSTSGKMHWKKSPSRRVKEGDLVGAVNNHGYVLFHFKGKTYRAHRVAWFIYYGIMPTLEIDHINGITTDNRINNLREVTHLENSKNMKLSKSNKSGYQGVCFQKNTGKWRVIIGVNNKQIELGSFDDLDNAIKKRKEAETKHGFHKNHGRSKPHQSPELIESK